MNDIILTLLFDFVLAVLLIATIGYCSKLSRRIRLLQDSRSELAGMITQFDNATERAVTSLAELQTVSKRITEALQLKIEKANFLADDLAFLIEKSAKVATQLEQAKAQRPQPVAQKPPPVFEPKLELESRSVPQLVKSKPAVSHVTILPADDIVQPRVASSLEAVLQRLASGGGSANTTPAGASSGAKLAPRTDAERELLAALKSGGR